MSQTIRGIHHVTAIASDAQANLDFYTGVLGLRLVKISVNQDDPGTYHFFYGDGTGRPGTGMTFFPYANAFEGQPGPGQSTAVAFRAPASSEPYWVDRLASKGVEYGVAFERLGERMIAFADPDGMPVEIAFVGGPSGNAWEGGGVPKEFAIVGFHGVTLTERHPEATIAFLTEEFGYLEQGSEGNRKRLLAQPLIGHSLPSLDPELGTNVDIVEDRESPHGRIAAGSIHHVAFRTPDAESQLAWHKRVQEIGLHVSPVTERFYFKSIYFREPGGVLFEIATDGPGWTVDESLESLGTRLFLPPWLESRRAEIESGLPKLALPSLSPQRPLPRGGRGGAGA